MTFQEEASLRRDILKIVCSSPKGAKWRKITLIPTGQAYFAEMLTDTQAFHKAIPFEEMTCGRRTLRANTGRSRFTAKRKR